MTDKSLEELMKSKVLPAPKYKEGDIVRVLNGERMMVRSHIGHILVGDGKWTPRYTLCPLNKDGKTPDKRMWSSRVNKWQYAYTENTLEATEDAAKECIVQGCDKKGYMGKMCHYHFFSKK